MPEVSKFLSENSDYPAYFRARADGHAPGYDVAVYARPSVWIGVADAITNRDKAIDDLITAINGLFEHPGDKQAWQDLRAAYDKHKCMTEEDEIGELIAHIEPNASLGMVAICRALRSKQQELVRKLMAGDITKADYVVELKQILAGAKADGERVIGAHAFRKTFGDFTVDNLMDVELFMADDIAP